MRTSFHHQPEAQHPNFQLSTSWQADYPIFGGEPELSGRMGLSHLDAICLALDLTVSNVVHPATVHRQHLRRNPT
jgi:hypothetical protein